MTIFILVLRVRQGDAILHPISDHMLAALILVGFDRYLGITLNLTDPENLEYVLSVLFFSLRDPNWNRPLWIGTYQFLYFLFHWSPGTIQ